MEVYVIKGAITLLLLMVATTANAVCDALKLIEISTLTFEDSWFAGLNPKWWNPIVSYKNKWVGGVEANGLKTYRFLFIKTSFFIQQLSDAPHFFKSLWVCCLLAMPWLWIPIPIGYSVVGYIATGFIWNEGFSYYYKVFKTKRI